MSSVEAILEDLLAEQRSLDSIVADRTRTGWSEQTASPGWSVADQIGHLAYFDHVAAVAILDEARFTSLVGEYRARSAHDPVVATLAPGGRDLDPAGVLAYWRDCRAELERAAQTLADDRRVNWFGPPMSARSFLTARLMETWAHGHDIAEALGATVVATDRLRHIAQIGVITRGWSYVSRGLHQPDVPVAVELTGPGGDTWSWGDPASTDRVTGPAEDFCLVVTQRRHLDDTALVCCGDAARDWMLKAQAYAGRPTTGPDPRGSSR